MLLAAHRKKPLQGVLIASPANPTGTMMTAADLQELCAAAESAGIRFISDEIYHGLDYAFPAETAARFSSDAVIINSFSKYFCMTGWRIGWMVLPEPLIRTVERLQGNLAISVPALSQIAAEAAFDGRDEMEAVKHGYEENRRILLDGLPKAGLDQMLPVDGALLSLCRRLAVLRRQLRFRQAHAGRGAYRSHAGRRLRSGARQALRPILLRRLRRRDARGGGAAWTLAQALTAETDMRCAGQDAEASAKPRRGIRRPPVARPSQRRNCAAALSLGTTRPRQLTSLGVDRR